MSNSTRRYLAMAVSTDSIIYTDGAAHPEDALIRHIAIAALIVMLGATSIDAHETFRFAGSVETRTATHLGVKTKAGRTVYVEIRKTTVILRDKTKVAATALKPGLSVVVDAVGDDDSEIVARQVRIVSAATPAAKAPR